MARQPSPDEYQHRLNLLYRRSAAGANRPYRFVSQHDTLQGIGRKVGRKRIQLPHEHLLGHSGFALDQCLAEADDGH
ncbi:MAG: hypothetical protein AzoDbin1_00585 [Azoarcus sp.]|uniref:Uncharacterized protein n=1 Tax=Aromatoleum tolulyticum TaxID=34027 RepID=A0A1N6R915_9RHOO|nr:hypothetical protein [Azoarcus sp.]SIQ25323.1 hypothetical protein SAMN05421829_103136 [Aromatoleum tolulyticum]